MLNIIFEPRVACGHSFAYIMYDISLVAGCDGVAGGCKRFSEEAHVVQQVRHD